MRIVGTYRVSRRRRLTTRDSVAADTATRRDAAALTARLFGPRQDSHDEDSPQGQKQLETGIRQTHTRSRSASTVPCLSPFPPRCASTNFFGILFRNLPRVLLSSVTMSSASGLNSSGIPRVSVFAQAECASRFARAFMGNSNDGIGRTRLKTRF
jgi:hypothetical protein